MSRQSIAAQIGSNIPMPATDARVARAKSKKEGMTRIILEENDNIPPSGQFFQLNGKPYMLQAGVEADVPPGIIEILDHAVESKPVIDPQSRQVTGYRDRLRFPYRIVKAKPVVADDEE